MKRLFTLLMVAFVAFSCEMLDGALDSKGKGLTFAEGTETTATFKARGGSKSFEFTADLDWTVTTSDEWITVTPESGSAGEGEIKVNVAENEGVKERTGYVDITLSNDKSFRIEVEQKEGDPIFEIGADGEIKVKAVGGEVELEVTTNIDYEVYIPEDAESWIEYVETRSVRNETVVLSVAVNDSEAERTAVIELRDEAGDTLEEFTIEQAAAESAEDEEPVFEIGDNGEYIVEAEGGDVEIEVTTNLEYSVYIPKDVEEWIEYVETRSVRNETVVLSVAENDSEKERTAVIELRDKSGDTLEEITIVQRGESAEDKEPGSEVPNNEIWYTTTDGMELDPYNTTVFGANLVDNTYVDGKGVLLFDGDVTTIGDSAFLRCSSLTSITIPDSVTTIGDYAVQDCSSLTSVTIPDSVTKIGSWAFGRCSSLTSVTIGNSVTTIGYFAFGYCSNLTSTTIPDSVTEIGESAFEGCSSFTSITIPNSVTTIGEATFRYCSSLTSITIPDSVTAIGYFAFAGCSSLTSITIPDSVTEIGESAFGSCDSLTEFKGKFASEDGRYLIIDGTLKSFAPAGVTEYTIPDGVTTIGYGAFYGCSSLTSITIPDSVTSIGGGAFNGCSSLTEFKGKFASEDGRCLIIDGTLKSFAPAGVTEYTIPDSVTTIGADAFSGCSSLTSITIPDSVTEIGDGAFYECSSLTSITIPDSVTAIGQWAFGDCSSLTSITIPDSVTEIGDYTFYWCRSLESVTIPDSVTTIGNYAFSGCNSLESVYCKPTTPPSLYYGVFEGNALGRKIYVPAESVEAYKTAFYYWSSYASSIVGYDF